MAIRPAYDPARNMASLNLTRHPRTPVLRFAKAWLVMVLTVVGCTEVAEFGRTAPRVTYSSRSLASDDPAGPSPGFVVKDSSGQLRTINGDPDIPRPVEHVWARDGHLAYLIPPYGTGVCRHARASLRAWIKGADPELIIREVDPDGPAKTFRDLQWTDAGSLRFTAACCGTVAGVSVTVPSGKLNLGPWKPVHPRRSVP